MFKKTQDNKIVFIYIHWEVYLVKNLKAKLLIIIDMLDLEEDILDLGLIRYTWIVIRLWFLFK